MTSFVIFIVRNDKTGLLEHHEIVRADDLPPRELALRSIAHTDQLNARYPLETYDVSSVTYDSFPAMSHHHPELKLKEDALILWS